MIMALTGQLMIFFIVIHVLGNSTIYFGWLNAYADHLQSLPQLVWLFRLLLFMVFSVHVFFGVWLKLENRRAKPLPYVVKKNLRATFASKNMIWTGVVIATFLVYHLLHFTIHAINPEMSASVRIDELGRPDVFSMVVLNFQNFLVSSLYILAMGALVLHLTHGIQSSFQTFGLNNERTLPIVTKAGSMVAFVLFLGYVAIPLVILFGMLGR